MSKNIGFNIKLSVDGKEVTIARQGVRDLGRALGTLPDKAEGFRNEMMKWSSISTIASGVYSAFQNLSGQLQGYIDKANAAAEARTKLATVMGQRITGFQSEDVDALNKVVAAQSALGVVSGTVQRNGLQQLATFATMRSTLETLLPAMNNLLVQQHGLNATSGDAVGIANLMGKALMGNSSALRRVGISFSEAQAELIKTGDEATRAATIAEVITQNVGNMNAELAKTDAGKVKQLQMYFGGLKVQLGQLLSPYQELISTVGQIGMAITGVVQMRSAVMGLGRALHLGSIVARAWNATAVRMRALFTAISATGRGAAVSMRTLRLAMQGLMIGTAVGLALTALCEVVVSLVGAADSAADSTDRLAAAQERANEAMEESRETVRQQAAQLEKDIATTKNFNGTKKEEVAMVERLNNTYGETMGYFSSVADWYKALTANSKAYCAQLVAEARQRVLANQIADLQQQAHDIRYDESGRARRYSTQRRTRAVTMQGGTAGAFTVDVGKIEGSSDLERAEAELGKLELRTKSLQRQLEETTKTARGTRMAVMGATDRPRLSAEDGKVSARAKSTQARTSAPKTEEARVPVVASMESVAAVSRQPSMGSVGSFDDIANMRIATVEGMKDRADRIKELFEAGVLAAQPAQRAIDNINASLEAMGAKKVDIEINSKSIDKTRAKVDGIGDAVKAVGQAFAAAGNAFELPALNVLGVVAQAVANVMLSYTQALAGASKLGPIGWVAFAASGLATALGVISQIKGATKFAKGGVVSGPTFAMVGEYAGASRNPEVIAPLDKLRAMIQPAEGGSVVGGELRVRGTDLVAVLANTTRLSGRKTGIRI